MNKEIFSVLERPQENEIIKTDELQVIGWCFSTLGGVDSIQILIDDKNVDETKNGIERIDVFEKFSSYESAINSGFRTKINLDGLSGGKHFLKIIAKSNNTEKLIGNIVKFELDTSLKIHPKDEMMNYIIELGFPAKDYFIQGRENAFGFAEAINQCKPTLLKGKKVLDYGCGHGRICRYLPKLLSPSKFVVADVWDDAVNFCAKEFNAIPFIITDQKTLSAYNSKFDVILSYSVFSHLPPSSFKLYLSEIAKCLEKDGIFLFTTKGEESAKQERVKLEDEFKFHLNPIPNETKGRLPGKEYGVMFVTSQYVEKTLKSVGLKILEYKPTSMTQQDLYVAQLC